MSFPKASLVFTKPSVSFQKALVVFAKMPPCLHVESHAPSSVRAMLLFSVVLRIDNLASSRSFFFFASSAASLLVLDIQ